VRRETEALLSARDLVKRYRIRSGAFGPTGTFAAVDGVSFDIGRGETLGLVGESGSGKSTTGRLLLRLEEPSGGRIFFEGEDWLALEGARLRRKRRDLQIVFQDPQTSLNPRMRCGAQLGEPLRVQGMARGSDLRDRVAALLEEAGLHADLARRYPSELSGGQRQRVAIARALATRPKFVVCDEPVSALDVSVAAQVLNLLAELREKSGLSYLFISHDLAVVSSVSDRIAVMYLGRIVEVGAPAELLASPLHPYTAALLSAAREGEPSARSSRIPLRGEPPSAAEPPAGCAFHPRCPIARPRCAQESPPLAPGAGGRPVACFFPGELALASR
jgi:oligopeptide/dipeptide ABC transporter ATP-binding protein